MHRTWLMSQQESVLVGSTIIQQRGRLRMLGTNPRTRDENVDSNQATNKNT
jgi:hypothetical protein